jgi:hypothetical protein
VLAVEDLELTVIIILLLRPPILLLEMLELQAQEEHLLPIPVLAMLEDTEVLQMEKLLFILQLKLQQLKIL